MMKIRRWIAISTLCLSIGAISLPVGAATLTQEIETESEMSDVKTAKKKLTKKQAKKKLKKWMKQTGLWNTSFKLEYDHREDNFYLFHYYEDMGDHNVTVNWYYVNRNNGEITSMF